MRIRAVAKLMRRALDIAFVTAVGIALGMSMKVWLVPRLPTPVATFLGAHKTQTMRMSGTETSGREVAFWKSSMIPNFISVKPGTDPMGMDLVPVYADEMAQEKLIVLSPEMVRNMGLRTVPVSHGAAQRSVRTVGKVDYAEPLLGDVSLKVSGWVEDLLVNFVGERVEKGQPLFTFYSPELVTTQEEYLLSLKQKPGGGGLSLLGLGRSSVYPVHDKLLFWDVPETEIEQVKQTGHSKKAITFQSPFAGWVIEKHVFKGMHMKPGARFYRIADLSSVWVNVFIYEFQLAWVREGLEARLTLPYRPGEVFQGKVIYVYPQVDPKTRQIKVRLEFPNPDMHLKPAMYADITIAAESEGSNLVVPLDAVINTGQTKTVDGQERHIGFAYVQLEPGRFEPREVTFGDEVEQGQLQVLDGLKHEESVVVSGQFQLDSDRRVKEANMRMITKMRGKHP